MLALSEYEVAVEKGGVVFDNKSTICKKIENKINQKNKSFVSFFC